MKRGFGKGLVVGLMAGLILAGGTAMAASSYVQAKLGQSVMLLNGGKISSAPKLTYGGTTYVQLYSIQQALIKAGFGAVWNGSKNPGVFSMTSPSTTTSTSTTQGSSGPTGTVSHIVGVSSLPYTYTSSNGLSITFNKITADGSGTVINITLANNGKADADSMMSNSSIAAGGQKIVFVNQDQAFYDAMMSLHPGQSITGNVAYAALPTGATAFTLYYDLSVGINDDAQSTAFDLTK